MHKGHICIQDGPLFMRINAYVVMAQFVLSLFVIAEAVEHWVQPCKAGPPTGERTVVWFSGSARADIAYYGLVLPRLTLHIITVSHIYSTVDGTDLLLDCI